jgi:heptaprenylglyceryl phosphate synthase
VQFCTDRGLQCAQCRGAMGLGNLVKVRTPASGGEVVTTAYIVFEQDAERAVNIIKRKIAQRTDEVKAVSSVSEELLRALDVAPGEFTRADGHPSDG